MIMYLIVLPGPAIGLNFTKISATIPQISWSELKPEVTNKAILFYSVQVDMVTDSVFQASVPGDNFKKSVLVTNLSKYYIIIIIRYMTHQQQGVVKS